MKKLFIYWIGLIALTHSEKANAQQGFSVSVKGIPQFSFMDNKDDNNNGAWSRKTTFNGSFGLGVAYNFTANLGVGVDGLYSFQGQRYKLDGTEYNQKNNYVKIPLYFSYNTDPNQFVSFIGKLGPQLSILADSKLDDKNGNTINSNTKSVYKNASLGGMLSAGAQFRLNRSLYLSAAWRFDYDFTNAEDKNYGEYVAGRASTHNITSGLEIGLRYLIGR